MKRKVVAGMEIAPKIKSTVKYLKHNYVIGSRKQLQDNIKKATHIDLLNAGKTEEGEFITIKIFVKL